MYPFLFMKKNYFSGMGRRDICHALKRADPALLTFGAGYIREMIWKYIVRYPLTDVHLNLLEQVALSYLEQPLFREFAPMCRAMTRLARPAFWETVKTKLDDPNPQVRLNARCLFPYAEGIYAGERSKIASQKARREKFRQMRPRELAVKEELLSIVQDPTNWKDGQLVATTIDIYDLPIASYYWEYDHLFAALDWSETIPEQLLPKLTYILNIARFEFVGVILYILYIMRKVDNPTVVPVIIRFLEQRVDYKIDSHKRNSVLREAFNALRHYGTPEALAAIEARRDQS
jgi:hypothetical protein